MPAFHNMILCTTCMDTFRTIQKKVLMIPTVICIWPVLSYSSPIIVSLTVNGLSDGLILNFFYWNDNTSNVTKILTFDIEFSEEPH